MQSIDFDFMFIEAARAGQDAANSAFVRPMMVVQHANPLNDASPVVYQEFVADGVCGFAWVIVKPGNSAFAKWLVKNGRARSNQYNGGGVSIWISAYNQSMQRKEAHANAMAAVFRKHGINAYADSRMD